MSRIIILEGASDVFTDLRDFFPPQRNLPPDMINNFSFSFSELKFSKSQYSKRMNTLLRDGSPDLNHYIPEIQNTDITKEVLLVLHDTELSYNFKSFIIFSKSVMDRLIPFFDYKFNSKLRKFSKKGIPFLNYLNNNYTGQNKDEFINLLMENKEKWLDDLIDLRDGIVHFSLLKEYISFHYILNAKSKKSLNTINDLTPPLLIYDTKKIPAINFLQYNFDSIKEFSKDFLTLCNI